MKKLVRSAAVRIFRLLKALTGYVPSEFIFKHLHFVGAFELDLPNDKRITLFSWGNRVENELAWRGWDGHEPHERQVWATLVSKGGDVLDIGANTGTFAFTAKGLSPESAVYAFEPIKRIAEKARKNCSVSGLDVKIVNTALAREKGSLPIFDPGGANAYSASLDAEFLGSEKESYLVPVTSIDEFCRENDLNPRSIKLDVEGYEGEVICGAGELLCRKECVIICEWLGSGESHNLARTMLTDAGYVAFDVVNFEDFDLSQEVTGAVHNIVLAPETITPSLKEELRASSWRN